jgi:hypothetical protein
MTSTTLPSSSPPIKTTMTFLSSLNTEKLSYYLSKSKEALGRLVDYISNNPKSRETFETVLKIAATRAILKNRPLSSEIEKELILKEIEIEEKKTKRNEKIRKSVFIGCVLAILGLSYKYKEYIQNVYLPLIPNIPREKIDKFFETIMVALKKFYNTSSNYGTETYKKLKTFLKKLKILKEDGEEKKSKPITHKSRKTQSDKRPIADVIDYNEIKSQYNEIKRQKEEEEEEKQKKQKAGERKSHKSPKAQSDRRKEEEKKSKPITHKSRKTQSDKRPIADVIDYNEFKRQKEEEEEEKQKKQKAGERKSHKSHKIKSLKKTPSNAKSSKRRLSKRKSSKRRSINPSLRNIPKKNLYTQTSLIVEE